ncbi:hypothetical protein F4054_12645 [Candidatus Poribacteria bacterium]|nr:hypothetical protein [Candidatus Poribacteria bacterium]MYG07311.1 hypothetical protein [Candidatus Poribacteria bacterium]MYK23090.1 hypothetical protein [Candidatus Poribacteria bacterium]
MQTEDKRSQIESWFMPEPKLQPVFLIIAGFFIICGLAIDTSAFRLIMAAVGALLGGLTYYLYIKAKTKYDARPSTDQMIQWLQEDLEALKERSLEMLTLDEENEVIAEESVILKGPIWWKVSGLDESTIQRGKTDGQGFLYSYWEIIILHAAENSLAVYSCEFNWPRNQRRNESTAEYFYQDIVSVRTYNESRSYKFLERDNKFAVGCGCLGYLNPFFVTRLLLNQFIAAVQGAFGNSFDSELPDFLKLKRKDEDWHIEGKVFSIRLSGDSAEFLIDSPQLEIYGADEAAKLGDKAATTISRRLREKRVG